MYLNMSALHDTPITTATRTITAAPVSDAFLKSHNSSTSVDHCQRFGHINVTLHVARMCGKLQLVS